MELIENLNFIEVWVKAGTTKNEVIRLSASSFKIYVTATPQDGKANKTISAIPPLNGTEPIN